MQTSSEENPSVTIFRNYLRIKTVQPTPDYGASAKFLQQLGEDLGAQVVTETPVPGKPVVVLSFPGRDPSLPSLLLNSHTDVVPVYPEQWDHDPFGAHKDAQGRIYGRGSQDMKSVGIQYVEALRRLKEKGERLLRTVHVSFVPDEEIGGFDGMGEFVKTETFKKLNVAFALDEGYASEDDDTYLVFCGERNPWWVEVKCSGDQGGQVPPHVHSTTCGEKVRRVVEAFLSFRDEQERKVQENPELGLGDVISCNLTMLKGGEPGNKTSSDLYIGFDMRIPPSNLLDEFETTLAKWCQDAGPGVTYRLIRKTFYKATTSLDPKENPWAKAFLSACTEMNMKIRSGIFPAGTDAKFLRQKGVGVLGFSPMAKTPRLLHDHNEYLDEKTFLLGIDIYCAIIRSLANMRD